MIICLRRFALLGVLTFTFGPAHAQFHEFRNADVAVGGTGQFTTAITSQSNRPHNGTSDSAGFLLTFRVQPIRFTPIELNYQYSSFSERFGSPTGPISTFVPLSLHEATAAYLLHPHFHRFRPFVGLGGGALYFDPSVHVKTQIRPAGLLEIGFDMRTSNPHLGFRVQGRSLLYRAPNFNNSGLSSSRWVSTSEPSASVYVRF